MPLSSDRTDITTRDSLDRRAFPVAANAVIWYGALVALNASGYLVPVTATTNLRTVGMANARVDNTGQADGAQWCLVSGKPARYDNSAGADEITRVNLGQTCYGVDDRTVALTDNTGVRSAAGQIVDVDNEGVWVVPAA